MTPWTAPCAAGRLAVRVVEETGRGVRVRMRDVSARHRWVWIASRTRTHVDAAAVADLQLVETGRSMPHMRWLVTVSAYPSLDLPVPIMYQLCGLYTAHVYVCISVSPDWLHSVLVCPLS